MSEKEQEQVPVSRDNHGELQSEDLTGGLYDDIICLPHSVSKKHPPMPLLSRAAQFAPFAALTGHYDALKETERQQVKRMEKL